MVKYLLRRLLGGLSVLFIVSLLAFGVYTLSPQDPARLLLQASGVDPITPQAVAAKRLEMGLDDPLPVRYARWLWGAVRGDFGVSFRSYQPVAKLYLERFPATFLLTAVTAALSLIISVPLGMLAAYKKGSLFDTLAQLIVVLGEGVPGFWIAFILIYVFAATLKWLPAFGSLTLQGIVLPALVSCLPYISILTRLTRSVLLDVLEQDYLRVARAKGLGKWRLGWRHALPNALGPILTVFGLEIAYLMTGAAIVEYVFAWPGIGKIAVDAALYGDIPVLVGFAVAAGVIYVLTNLIIDLTLAFFDPRHKEYERGQKADFRQT